jgi:hypothetical protein
MSGSCVSSRICKLACPGHDAVSQPPVNEGRVVQGKLFVPPQFRLIGKALSMKTSVAACSAPLLLSVWASCPAFHCMHRAREELGTASFWVHQEK